MTLQCFIVLLWFTIFCNCELPESTGEADLITNLPGLTFQFTSKQYSGHLNASRADIASYHHYLHYWFIQSQNNPETDPVVLWLNGGPGCSSIGGLLDELGPFHPNRDGLSLWENVFSWTKKASIIFIDSPACVGYSYVVDGNCTTDDDQTADDLVRALVDFFTVKFPAFARTDFFIAGESYAGVYIPMLAARVVTYPNFPANLRGIAVGNGVLNRKYLEDSLIIYLWSHGIIGDDLFNQINSICNCTSHNLTCSYFDHVIAQPKENEVLSDGTTCGNLTWQWTENFLDTTLNDPYNLYQDCYVSDSDTSSAIKAVRRKALTLQKVHRNLFDYLAMNGYDTPKYFNYDSTDTLQGFQCYSQNASGVYMNLPAVRSALHVDKIQQLQNVAWADCNMNVFYNDYTSKYFDMSPYFETIIQHSKAHILIYNGDADTVCNFIGDGWFMEKVAADNKLSVINPRQAWYYKAQIGGYVKQYQRVDILTVKGAGHYVPTDRAGPALQMVMNLFEQINGTLLDIPVNYSRPLLGISTTLKPPLGPTSTPSATEKPPLGPTSTPSATEKPCTCNAASKFQWNLTAVITGCILRWLLAMYVHL